MSIEASGRGDQEGLPQSQFESELHKSVYDSFERTKWNPNSAEMENVRRIVDWMKSSDSDPELEAEIAGNPGMLEALPLLAMGLVAENLLPSDLLEEKFEAVRRLMIEHEPSKPTSP